MTVARPGCQARIFRRLGQTAQLPFETRDEIQRPVHFLLRGGPVQGLQEKNGDTLFVVRSPCLQESAGRQKRLLAQKGEFMR